MSRRAYAPLCLLAFLIFIFTLPHADAATRPFKSVLLAEGFNDPTALVVLPDGSSIVAQRDGTVFHLRGPGVFDKIAAPLPELSVLHDQSVYMGGLLDIAADPDFRDNGLIYFAYLRGDIINHDIAVLKARLDDGALVSGTLIFESVPKRPRACGIDAKMTFAADRTLLVAVSNMCLKDRRPQDVDHDLAKIVRINRDGSIPGDNPFAKDNDPDFRPEIYAPGDGVHGGLALDPVTKTVWVSHFGLDIGRVDPYIRHNNGMTLPDDAPFLLWQPSIGATGIDFYNGDLFPEWRGSLLLGAGPDMSLRVVKMQNGLAVSYRDYPTPDFPAACNVKSAPDGSVLALTCGFNSRLFRIVPNP